MRYAKLIDGSMNLQPSAQRDRAENMNEVSGVKILVQAMATTEFWAGMAFILVSVEDVLLATGQRQKRSRTETNAGP